MTQEEALKAFEKMYGEIDKENWLFIGTINPQMVEHAIKALSIIRCKDCGQREYGCSTFIDHNQIYGFCAWGWIAERKEE